jgi:hypothetical protein
MLGEAANRRQQQSSTSTASNPVPRDSIADHSPRSWDAYRLSMLEIIDLVLSRHDPQVARPARRWRNFVTLAEA